MDTLRKPFLIIALILMVLVVGVEVGAGLLLRGVPPPAADIAGTISGALPAEIREDLDDDDLDDTGELAAEADDVPGTAIPYMAVLDGMLLFTVILFTLPLVITDAAHARVQGCASFLISLVLILAAFVMIILAIIFLIFMVALLLAVPFGTIAYLALFGFFDRGGAAAVLSLLMLLKIGFAVCLFVAQQRFLQNRGLVLLIVSSLVANIVIGFLHGFVPGFLVSITDAIGGIIVALCGCIWWILALIGAVPAILRVLRLRAS